MSSFRTFSNSILSKVGESDWTSEHLGIISGSVAKGNNVFVYVNSETCKHGGVVASLTPDGRIQWRSFVNKVVEFKKVANNV